MLISRAFNVRILKSNGIPFVTLGTPTGFNVPAVTVTSIRTAPNPMSQEEYLARDATKFGMGGTGTNAALSFDTNISGSPANIGRVCREEDITYDTRINLVSGKVDNYVFITIGTSNNTSSAQIVIELTRDELVAGGLVLKEDNSINDKSVASSRIIKLTHTLERPY